MVERLEDKSQKNLSTSLGKKEADAWNKLVMFLRVVDTILLDEFQKRGPESFTWNKKNPLVAWSRLDCFYVNSSIQVQGGTHRI